MIDKKGLFNLDNSISIVTGASRGNGLSIANGLSKSGSKIVGVDLHKTNFDYNIVGDVSSKTTLKKISNFLQKNSFSNLILVNNAGITLPSSYPYPLDLWNKTIKTNLTAPFLLIENLIPFFKKIKKGSIINITSLASEKAFPNNPSYVSSKGGLKMLTKFYAKSLGDFGVRANNIGPGYIETDMTKKSFLDKHKNLTIKKHTFLNRWGSSEDLVGVCIFLASDASSYITGQDIYVDGGWLSNGMIE